MRSRTFLVRTIYISVYVTTRIRIALGPRFNTCAGFRDRSLRFDVAGFRTVAMTSFPDADEASVRRERLRALRSADLLATIEAHAEDVPVKVELR